MFFLIGSSSLLVGWGGLFWLVPGPGPPQQVFNTVLHIGKRDRRYFWCPYHKNQVYAMTNRAKSQTNGLTHSAPGAIALDRIANMFADHNATTYFTVAVGGYV
jgi:hypothetical protein